MIAIAKTKLDQRHRDAKQMFDSLWRDMCGPFRSVARGNNSLHMRRHRAYQWLAEELDRKRPSLYRLSLDECDEIIRRMQALTRKQRVGLLPPPATEAEAKKRERYDLEDLALWMPGEPKPVPVASVIQ